LYVNHFTLELGAEGRQAVETLFARARAARLIPAITTELFLGLPAGSAGR
jgi:predicted solute-binding protein